MSRDECKAAVIQALGRHPMTISQIMRATGCNRDAVLGVIHGAPFEYVGQRRISRTGKASVYRLAQPQPLAPLTPLERPSNPVVDKLVLNQLDLGRMIRRMATQGDREAAMVLVKVWQREDLELKQICGRIEEER